MVKVSDEEKITYFSFSRTDALNRRTVKYWTSKKREERETGMGTYPKILIRSKDPCASLKR